MTPRSPAAFATLKSTGPLWCERSTTAFSSGMAVLRRTVRHGPLVFLSGSRGSYDHGHFFGSSTKDAGLPTQPEAVSRLPAGAPEGTDPVGACTTKWTRRPQ